MAACLSWGEGAVISHGAAAGLWRLSGFEPGPVEVTVPVGRRRRGPGVVHRNVLLPGDATIVEAIPVTTPPRTLIDVASIAPPDVVEESLDDALRRRLVSIPWLRWRLAGSSSGRPGVTVMRGLVDARGTSSMPQSVFETRLLRLLKRAGLPQALLQYEIRSGRCPVAVVDFAFPRKRLAIEADGYRWHSGRARWDHDRSRRNELTLLGWRVIHVTWTDLAQRPDAVVDSIRQALTAKV